MPLNDLLSTLLALAGLIGATALGVLGELPLLADLLIGAGVGALIAKAVIGRLERGGRELRSLSSPMRQFGREFSGQSPCRRAG